MSSEIFMSAKRRYQDSVVSLLKARVDRLDARIDGSFAKLRTQRGKLDRALEQLTNGLRILSEAPLLEESREGVQNLLTELADAKAELDQLANALERIHYDDGRP